MARGPVNRKDLAIESNYGYLNLHLENFFRLLNNPNVGADEMERELSELKKLRSTLIKLGYFEGGNNNGRK